MEAMIGRPSNPNQLTECPTPGKRFESEEMFNLLYQQIEELKNRLRPALIDIPNETKQASPNSPILSSLSDISNELDGIIQRIKI